MSKTPSSKFRKVKCNVFNETIVQSSCSMHTTSLPNLFPENPFYLFCFYRGGKLAKWLIVWKAKDGETCAFGTLLLNMSCCGSLFLHFKDIPEECNIFSYCCSQNFANQNHSPMEMSQFLVLYPYWNHNVLNGFQNCVVHFILYFFLRCMFL